MKSVLKSVTIFLFALLFVLSVPLALAQEAESEITVDPQVEQEAGITASNPFWGLDRALEKISLSLTFNRASKAEKGLRYADERLAELQVLIAENNVKEISQAQQAYEQELTQVTKQAEEIESGDGASGAEDALEDVAEIQALLNAHYDKVSSIKDRILDRQGDMMSEAQINQLKEVFSDLESKAQETETQIETKRENVKLKYKVLSETTDGEVEKVEEEIEERIRKRAEEIKVENEDETREVKDDEIKIESEEETVDDNLKERIKARLEKQ